MMRLAWRCVGVLACAVMSVASASSQPTTWYFGARATLTFDGSQVTPGTWLDSCDAPPGIFYGADGKATYYHVPSGVYDRHGRKLAKAPGYPKEDPYIFYATPLSLMLRYPGTTSPIVLINTNQVDYNRRNPQYWRRSNGSLTATIIDPHDNGGEGSVAWYGSLIVDTYRPDGFPSKLVPASSLVLAPHANGRDLWLIVDMMQPREFWVFRVTSTGIDTSQKVRSPHEFQRLFRQDIVKAEPDLEHIGEMKVSPDGTKLAVCTGARTQTVLFDFDISTGQLTNERDLSDSSLFRFDPTGSIYHNMVFIDGSYGVEFSPDGTKLYMTWIQLNGLSANYEQRTFVHDSARGELSQFDITLSTADEIRASKQIIAPMSYDNWFGGMQLGPDGKIYIAQRDRPYVSRIENPNAAGAACGFTKVGLELAPGTLCGEGFPFVMSTTLGKGLRIASQEICDGDTMSIPLVGGFVTDSVRWDFGDPSSTSNEGYGRVGRHRFTGPGAYYVTATMYVGSEPQTPVSTFVVVNAMPSATASAEPMRVCAGDTVTLRATGGTLTQWYAGTDITPSALIATGSTVRLPAAAPGQYTVVVETAFGCRDTTTVSYVVLPSPTIAAIADTTVCMGSECTISTTIQGATSIVWRAEPEDPTLQSAGERATFRATADRIYVVEATGANGCIASERVAVTVGQLPLVAISGDTMICRPIPVRLAATGGRSYLWVDEQGAVIGTDSVITPTPGRTTRYIVHGTADNGCIGSDTVVVTLRPDIDVAIAGDSLSCDGVPVTLRCALQPPGDASIVRWLDASGNVVGTGAELTIAPSRTTIYRAALPLGGACADTAEFTVSAGSAPQFSIAPVDTTVCSGDTVSVMSTLGTTQRVVAVPGRTRIDIRASDSVGCVTTRTADIVGIAPGMVDVRAQDVTIDIAQDVARIPVHVSVPTQLVGAVIGPMRLRLEHRASSFQATAYVIQPGDVPVTPLMVSSAGGVTTTLVEVPSFGVREASQPLIEIVGRPLIDTDTTTMVRVAVLDAARLSSCIDSIGRDGSLTITGCGREYYAGITIGEPLLVRAYPNPTEDLLTISIDIGQRGPINVSVVDALGRLVYGQTIERAHAERQTSLVHLDFSSSETGAYRMIVTAGAQQRIIGIVVR